MQNTTVQHLPYYFHEAYLSIHASKQFLYRDNNIFCVFIINDQNHAISLSKSPFGGIFILPPFGESERRQSIQKLIAAAQQADIKKLIINQPPSYYPNFISTATLIENGFEQEYEEINQMIDLTAPIHLHKMQQRHLKKDLSGFTIREATIEELPQIHAFIALCRKAQGLEINISEANFLKQYSLFESKTFVHYLTYQDQIITALVSTIVTSEIAYYYLPATHPDFKKLSPMTHLMNFIFDFYRQKGMKYFDLGISSVFGKPQTGLLKYKERMGAKSFAKPTLSLNIA